MNMIDVYTAFITVDTTLQPGIHKIPDNVSSVIIHGLDYENGVSLPKSVNNIRLINCKSLSKLKYPHKMVENVVIEGGEMQRIKVPFTRNFTVKNCADLVDLYSNEVLQYKFNVRAYNCPKLNIVYLNEVEADTLLMDNCPDFDVAKSLNFYQDKDDYGRKKYKYHLCKHLIYKYFPNSKFTIGDVLLRDVTILNSPNITEMEFPKGENNYRYSSTGIEKLTIGNCPNVAKYNAPANCDFSING
mgnify:CR=1 FL=1